MAHTAGNKALVWRAGAAESGGGGVAGATAGAPGAAVLASGGADLCILPHAGHRMRCDRCGMLLLHWQSIVSEGLTFQAGLQ